MKKGYLGKKKIFLIAAARPNFMKIAPLYHALKSEPWALPLIIHTGQHYDITMSRLFFEDLDLPEPYVNLGVGSGTHAEQTGKVMTAFETLALEEAPDLTVVVGDVNSTMACTIAAAKLGLKVAHLEAGLRSFDRTMPEEINRIVTDSLADILWTPSRDADENLLNEGISPQKIKRVGNIMIDSLLYHLEKVKKTNILESLSLKQKSLRSSPSVMDYCLLTLHRPSNVDQKESLNRIVQGLLAGETLEWSFEGKRRKIRFLNPEAGFIEISERIPLHVSAFGPRARALTAELAEGWVNFLTLQPLAVLAAQEMSSACRDVGRNPDTLYKTAFTLGCVLADSEPADGPRARAQAAGWRIR